MKDKAIDVLWSAMLLTHAFPLCKQIDGPANCSVENTLFLSRSIKLFSLFQRTKEKKNLEMKNKAFFSKFRVIHLFRVKRDRMREGKFNQHY